MHFRLRVWDSAIGLGAWWTSPTQGCRQRFIRRILLRSMFYPPCHAGKRRLDRWRGDLEHALHRMPGRCEPMVRLAAYPGPPRPRMEKNIRLWGAHDAVGSGMSMFCSRAARIPGRFCAYLQIWGFATKIARSTTPSRPRGRAPRGLEAPARVL
jgi:hypothetical protein